MANSYTNEGIIQQVTGENSGTWGTYINTNNSILDLLVGGFLSQAITNVDVTLPNVNGVADNGKNAMIKTTGVLAANVNLIVPTISRRYTVWNANTGSYTMTVKTSAGTGIAVPQGTVVQLMCDGTNVVEAVTAVVGALTLGTPLTPGNGGTNSAFVGFSGASSSIKTYTLPNASDTIACLGQSQAFTKQQNFGTATLTDGATISWDVSAAQVAKVTLGGNRTMAAPTNLVDGGTYILRVIQDGTGSRTITWNSVFKWPSGTAPTLTTTASAVDIITFISDGTNLDGVASLNFS